MSDADRKRVAKIAAIDQASKAISDGAVPLLAGIFRSFCAQDGVTREDAVRLTGELYRSLIGLPPKKEPTDGA